MLFTLIIIFTATEVANSAKQYLNVYLAEPFNCEDFPGCFTRNQFSSMGNRDPNIFGNNRDFKNKFEVVDNEGVDSGNNNPRTDQNLRPYSNMVRINDRGPINGFRTNYNPGLTNNQGLNRNQDIHRHISYKEGGQSFKSQFKPHYQVSNPNLKLTDSSHIHQPNPRFKHDSGLSMHQNTIDNHGNHNHEVFTNQVRGARFNSSPLPKITKSHNFESAQILPSKFNGGHHASLLNENNDAARNIQQGSFHATIGSNILQNSLIHGNQANLGTQISKDQQNPHLIPSGQGHMSQRLKYAQSHYASPLFMRQDILGKQSNSKQHVLAPQVLPNQKQVFKQKQLTLNEKVRIRQIPNVGGSINSFSNSKGLPRLNLPVGQMNIASDSKVHFSFIKPSKSPRRPANRRMARMVSVKENLREPDILKTRNTSEPYNLSKFGNVPISHGFLLSGPSAIDGKSNSHVKQQLNRSEVKNVNATENYLLSGPSSIDGKSNSPVKQQLNKSEVKMFNATGNYPKTFFLLKSGNEYKSNILSKIANVSEPAMEPTELLLKHRNFSEPDFFLISRNSSEPDHPSKYENNRNFDLLLQYENSSELDFLSIYGSSIDTDLIFTSGNSSKRNFFKFGNSSENLLLKYENISQPDLLLIPGSSSEPDYLSKSDNSSETELLLTNGNSSEPNHLLKLRISSDSDNISKSRNSSKSHLPLEYGNNSELEFILTSGNSNETKIFLKSRNHSEPILFIKYLLGEPSQYHKGFYKSGKQQTYKRVERTADKISTESRLLKYLLSRLTQSNGQGNSSSLETRLINSLLLGNNRGLGQTVHATRSGSESDLLRKLMSNVLTQYLEKDNITGSNGQTGIGLGLLGSNPFGHLLGEHNSAFGNPNPLGQNLTSIGLSGILKPHRNSISNILSQNGGGTLKGLELLRNSTFVKQLFGQGLHK